ncbi:MAG: sarcosine oxidase subunit alpha family protein [Proteobacteria bacterium]|nr:sarcosine oxidase subunit alpha family protein [Pseudomonadota bacterium]
MSQINRLGLGRLTNPDAPVVFSFNGQRLSGLQGDTLASALLANGVTLVGRSFKYGRPRGIVAAGVEEPNAILQVGSLAGSTVPNVRATEQALFQGLTANTTHGWPSVKWDVMGLFGQLAGALMPPGFYYKTFMYPQWLWHTYEKIIRKAAGLGHSPTEPDPDIYDKCNQHCDVLIIGAGPAGLASALVAEKSGSRVILVDEHPVAGGWLKYSDDSIDTQPGHRWAESTLETLKQSDRVTVLLSTTATGLHDGKFVTAVEKNAQYSAELNNRYVPRQRLHRIRAKHIILASGAHERPLVYANNDVPGCMLAGAVSAYIKGYGVRPGRRLVVATNNDAGYAAALDWLAISNGNATVVDARSKLDANLVERVEAAGGEVITGAVVIEAKGRRAVSGAVIAKIDAEFSTLVGAPYDLPADVIASSGGFSPVVHLSAHTGRKPVWRHDIAGFVPAKDHPEVTAVGAAAGEFSLHGAIATGVAAAANAHQNQREATEAAAELINSVCDERLPFQLQPLYLVPHSKASAKAPPQFVDFQLDVTAAAIALATREGFESVEHVKRYTALGFGTDQGKLANVNGIAIASQALGQSIEETGTTMFRPNYTPASFGVMAGRDVGGLFEPKRYTPMQPWHEARGAAFEDVGQWKRPWFFPEGNESLSEAVARECLAVRQGVGILDASTLGKIDIQGPDARIFLNRIYTNAWSKLAVGKCRYGLMCGEDGMVMDDGVTACLGDHHFLMTTTTGGAASVLQWLELWHQTEWPELEVYFNSVTDHWATATLSGPDARSLLQGLTDIDLQPAAFGFMDWRQGQVAGIPARVFRISFTGELSYEINVNANYGLALWQQLMTAGSAFNLTPYGTETMHVLRAEKGFVIVGQDTDGSVTPEDLGMQWALASKKTFSYIGKRGMARADCQRPDRKQLVGLSPLDTTFVLPEGGQIVWSRPTTLPATMVGHVTSSYFSPILNRSFALALVEGGLNRLGEVVEVSVGQDAWQRAEIVSSVFYDPNGERQYV